MLTMLVAATATLPTNPAQPTPPPEAKPTRYCIVEAITGSVIPRRTCKTREAWLREGFDPLAK